MTSALAYPLGRGVAKVEGDLRELGGFVTNCPPTHFVRWRHCNVSRLLGYFNASRLLGYCNVSRLVYSIGFSETRLYAPFLLSRLLVGRAF